MTRLTPFIARYTIWFAAGLVTWAADLSPLWAFGAGAITATFADFAEYLAEELTK